MALLVIQTHPLTLVVIIVVWAIAIPLMIWNYRIVTRFENSYRYDSEFPGARYDCQLRFANTEFYELCSVGADQSALYLLPAANQHIPWLGSNREMIFKKKLRIPWTDLQYRFKRITFKECVWFEIPERKIYFYIPKDVGERALTDAGRAVPIEA